MPATMNPNPYRHSGTAVSKRRDRRVVLFNDFFLLTFRIQEAIDQLDRRASHTSRRRVVVVVEHNPWG